MASEQANIHLGNPKSSVALATIIGLACGGGLVSTAIFLGGSMSMPRYWSR